MPQSTCSLCEAVEETEFVTIENMVSRPFSGSGERDAVSSIGRLEVIVMVGTAAATQLSSPRPKGYPSANHCQPNHPIRRPFTIAQAQNKMARTSYCTLPHTLICRRSIASRRSRVTGRPARYQILEQQFRITDPEDPIFIQPPSHAAKNNQPRKRPSFFFPP